MIGQRLGEGFSKRLHETAGKITVKNNHKSEQKIQKTDCSDARAFVTSVLQVPSHRFVLFTVAKATGGPGSSDKPVDVSWRMPAGRWDRRCHPAANGLRGAAPE